VNRSVCQTDNSECGYYDCQKNKFHIHFFASLTGGTRLRHLTPFFSMRRAGCPSHFSPIASRQARWRSANRRAASLRCSSFILFAGSRSYRLSRAINQFWPAGVITADRGNPEEHAPAGKMCAAGCAARRLVRR
jgi:hypothetical protein